MDKVKQRIAIGRNLGYRPFDKHEDPRFWFHPKVKARALYMTCALPDYLADLNAMYSAWKTLGDEQRHVFRSHVTEIAKRESIWFEESAALFGGEAFLRTIEKWEESNG